MRVAEIMKRGVRVIEPDTSICEAARLMRDGDFGSLPVVENEKPIGMITDRDIVVRGLAVEKGLETPVRDIMTPKAVACAEDDDLNQVAFIMSEAQIRRILVTDRNGVIVGIVSLGDIAQHARTAEQAEVVLSEISQPSSSASNLDAIEEVRH